MAMTTTRNHSLATVSDEEFRRFVDEDVRRSQPVKDHSTGRKRDRTAAEIAELEEIHQELRSPEVLERWYNCLLLAKKSVEAQLGAKRADLNARRDRSNYDELQLEFNRWKAGTLRFLNAVEEKLLEARSLRYRTYVPQLRSAIESHRQAVLNDQEPEPADERLWSVLKDLPTGS